MNRENFKLKRRKKAEWGKKVGEIWKEWGEGRKEGKKRGRSEWGNEEIKKKTEVGEKGGNDKQRR
ncbi:MAG: hypothetical protein ACRCR2_02090 [Fusobacteriaceae bacterium]